MQLNIVQYFVKLNVFCQVTASGLISRGHQVLWKAPGSTVNAIGRDVFTREWIGATDTERCDGVPAGI